MIRTWKSYVGVKNGAPGQITISIFDPEGNSPVLIEFLYQQGGHQMDFSHVADFKRKAKNKFIHATKNSNGSSSFELKLKYNSALFSPHYYNAFAYKPLLIEFGMNKGRPFSALNLENDLRVSLGTKSEDFTRIDFKPTTPLLFVRTSTGLISFKDYFEAHSIEFPAHQPGHSDLKANKKDSARIEKTNNDLSEKRITRWTASTKDGRSGEKIEITISVFDAETNPALMEMEIRLGETVYFEEIKNFEIIGKKPGHFKIDFKSEIFITPGTTDFDPYFVEFMPFLPKSISFKVDDKEPEFVFEELTKGLKISVKAKRESLSAQNFDSKSIDRLVLEPSTIHPLTYQKYFRPKGIRFPKLEKKSATSAKFYSKKNDFKSSPPIKKLSDLKLGPLLKGKEAAVWELLNSKNKPTLSEFLKVIELQPSPSDANPFEEYSMGSAHLKKELINDLPLAIAQFEKAFPEAIWYALGRDIYLFGDAMDAYYLYRGEKDRVLRLPASQPSFDEEDPEQVVDFLKTNGFDFDQISKNTKPRIIFDITSYSKGTRFSQSSQLMRAAYMEWAKKSKDPHSLLEKINFVSVSPGSNNVMITPNLDIKGFFKNMSFDPPAPKQILQVNGPQSLQYCLTWHGIYKAFKRNPKNKSEVLTQHGPPSSYSDKLAMLSELWDVAAIVMNGGFASAVEKQLKILNDPKSDIPSLSTWIQTIDNADKDTIPDHWGNEGPVNEKAWFASEPKASPFPIQITCDDFLKKPIGSK